MTMQETFTIDACEEAFVRDFCPYKGSPDPLVVWRAAWQAARAHALDEACDKVAFYGGPVDLEAAIRALSNP